MGGVVNEGSGRHRSKGREGVTSGGVAVGGSAVCDDGGDDGGEGVDERE